MKFIRQCFIIFGLTLAGEFLNRLLPLPVPAGVYGHCCLRQVYSFPASPNGLLFAQNRAIASRNIPASMHSPKLVRFPKQMYFSNRLRVPK